MVSASKAPDDGMRADFDAAAIFLVGFSWRRAGLRGISTSSTRSVIISDEVQRDLPEILFLLDSFDCYLMRLALCKL